MSTQTSGSEDSMSTPPGPSHTQPRAAVPGISKPQMNRMIMDYLVKHGYSQAAEDFAKEAGIEFSGRDASTVEQRKRIKHAIYAGEIQKAIEELNEINSTVLENNKDLHFQLLNLQLVEKIKAENAKPNGDIYECVNFAQENLAPRAPSNPVWKDQLEKTMALLVFDHKKLVPELQRVISPDLRVKVAEDANQAVLRETGENPIAGLVELLQTRVFAEEEARKFNKWPEFGLDIGLEHSTAATAGTASNGNSNGEDHPMAG